MSIIDQSGHAKTCRKLEADYPLGIRIVGVLLNVLAGTSMIGCSAYSAATRPAYKDTSIIAAGASRSQLIDKIGQPCKTYQKDGKRTDVFELSDAAATFGQKMGLTALNAFFGVLSLGASEVMNSGSLGNTEARVRSRCTAYTVTYGPDDKAESVETEQEEQWPPLAEAPGGLNWPGRKTCGIDYHTPACESTKP